MTVAVHRAVPCAGYKFQVAIMRSRFCATILFLSRLDSCALLRMCAERVAMAVAVCRTCRETLSYVCSRLSVREVFAIAVVREIDSGSHRQASCCRVVQVRCLNGLFGEGLAPVARRAPPIQRLS